MIAPDWFISSKEWWVINSVSNTFFLWAFDLFRHICTHLLCCVISHFHDLLEFHLGLRDVKLIIVCHGGCSHTLILYHFEGLTVIWLIQLLPRGSIVHSLGYGHLLPRKLASCHICRAFDLQEGWGGCWNVETLHFNQPFLAPASRRFVRRINLRSILLSLWRLLNIVRGENTV